jgi:protoheme IX farnesyltransferase
VAVSLLPAVLGLASAWYGAAALAVGAGFLWQAAAFLRPANRDAGARRLFLCSLAYLPLVLGLLVADRLLLNRP